MPTQIWWGGRFFQKKFLIINLMFVLLRAKCKILDPYATSSGRKVWDMAERKKKESCTRFFQAADTKKLI